MAGSFREITFLEIFLMAPVTVCGSFATGTGSAGGIILFSERSPTTGSLGASAGGPVSSVRALAPLWLVGRPGALLEGGGELALAGVEEDGFLAGGALAGLGGGVF